MVFMSTDILYPQQRAIFRDSFRREDFKVVTFQGNSTPLWDISPPSRNALQRALNPDRNSNKVRLTFSWRVSRYVCKHTLLIDVTALATKLYQLRPHEGLTVISCDTLSVIWLISPNFKFCMF